MAYSPGLAILVAFLAGFATVIGGGVSILLTKHVRPITFAAALAFAAGCTLTVAFADVLPEGQEAWHDALSGDPSGHVRDMRTIGIGDIFKRPVRFRVLHAEAGGDSSESKHAALGLFIMLVGWQLASTFDRLLHWGLDAYDHYVGAKEHVHVGVCAHDHAHDHAHTEHDSFRAAARAHKHDTDSCEIPMMEPTISHHDFPLGDPHRLEDSGYHLSHNHDDLSQNLDHTHLPSAAVHGAPHDHSHGRSHSHGHSHAHGHSFELGQVESRSPRSVSSHTHSHVSKNKRTWWQVVGRFLLRLMVNRSTLSPDERMEVDRQFISEAKKISRIGYFTAVVLALHNIPEGMALYGTATVDSRAGLGLAVAIALHNLPQGMAVAVPIYIGLRSKTKALLFSLAAALAQPIGALIGYGIVGSNPSDTVMSVILLLTAGVLFNASLKELYASAVRYDKGNQVCGSFMFLGMLVMCGTLVALAYL